MCPCRGERCRLSLIKWMDQSVMCHVDSHDNQRDGAVEEVRLLSLFISVLPLLCMNYVSYVLCKHYVKAIRWQFTAFINIYHVTTVMLRKNIPSLSTPYLVLYSKVILRSRN